MGQAAAGGLVALIGNYGQTDHSSRGTRSEFPNDDKPSEPTEYAFRVIEVINHLKSTDYDNIEVIILLQSASHNHIEQCEPFTRTEPQRSSKGRTAQSQLPKQLEEDGKEIVNFSEEVINFEEKIDSSALRATPLCLGPRPPGTFG